jgi:DNA-binding MurR/RpiR family transcriptional regulator
MTKDVEQLRAQLSPRRQDIVRPLFERPREYVLLSLRACAESLGTDAAFLSRVVRQLGFAHYADFKAYLHNLSSNDQSSFDRLKARKRNSDLEQTPHECIERSLQNIHALQNTLDTPKMIALARRVHAARRVFLLGSDMARPVSDYLSYQLGMLGIIPVSLHGTGETLHAAATFRHGDVVFGITFRRGLRVIVESLQIARQHGAYSVAITSQADSPAARFADEAHLVSVAGTALRSSYTAAFVWVDAFVNCCAQANRRKVLGILNQAHDEQKGGYRWFKE